MTGLFRCKSLPSRGARQSGNVFFTLFGAVALVGVVGVASMQVLKGPVRTMAEVTKRTVAENNMIASSRLAIVGSANATNADCDADGYVEPIEPQDAGADPKPTGGGYLPPEIGAALNDPWDTRFAYCAWDHGAVTTQCATAKPLLLDGAASDAHYAIAVISAGPDRMFQTACNAYVDTTPADGTPDVALLAKTPGSDDIVLGYTYAEANAVGGGLWTLKSGDPDTAQIAKDLEVKDSDGDTTFALNSQTGVGDFIGIITGALTAKGTNPLSVTGGLKLDVTPIETGACTAANTDAFAFDTAGDKLIRCNGSTWVAAGGVDNLGNHLATQNVRLFSAAGGPGSPGGASATMVSGWPDAIMCNVTNPAWGPSVFYLRHAPTGSSYFYRTFDSAADYAVIFNATGAFTGYQGLTTTDCNASTATLYSSGKAFNFVGGGAGGGSSGSGFVDGNSSIPSGTQSVTSACSTYTDINNTSKSVTFPSTGFAAFDWSASFYVTGAQGSGDFRICYGTTCSPAMRQHTNEASSHKHVSGTWATSIVAGTYTVKLQACLSGGPNLTFDVNDYAQWSVVVPGGGSGGGSADNLGNHTATANVQLGSYWLSGDGGNEGLRIDASGNVGIGTSSPTSALHIAGAGVRGMVQNTTAGANAGWRMNVTDSTAGSQNGGIYLVPANPGTQRYIGLSADDTSYQLLVRADGKVGIGTTNLSDALLTIGGTSTIGLVYTKSGSKDARISVQDPTKAWSIASGWGTAGDFSIVEEGVAGDRLYIKQGGNVGIGTASPSYLLHVNGTAYATGAAGALSDIRHKKNVTSLEDGALDLIAKLRPVSFEWKDPRDDGMRGQQLGFIAQEVEKVLPQLVLTQDDADQTKGLKPTELVAILTKAVQELRADNIVMRRAMMKLANGEPVDAAALQPLVGDAIVVDRARDHNARLLWLLIGVIAAQAIATTLILLKARRPAP